jgi:hypothetical protein
MIAVLRAGISDIDKNLGSAFIMAPIAPMTAVLNKRVVVMMFVDPTLVVMVIGHGAPCTNGDEDSNTDGSCEILPDGFHAVN